MKPIATPKVLASWFVTISELGYNRLQFYTYQSLPGVTDHSITFSADAGLADELAAVYDDGMNELRVCYQLFSSVLEDVTNVQTRLF